MFSKKKTAALQVSRLTSRLIEKVKITRVPTIIGLNNIIFCIKFSAISIICMENFYARYLDIR